MPGCKAARPFAYNLGAASPAMIALGTLGGFQSKAQSVSGGIVAGYSLLPNGDERAVIWSLPLRHDA